MPSRPPSRPLPAALLGGLLAGPGSLALILAPWALAAPLPASPSHGAGLRASGAPPATTASGNASRPLASTVPAAQLQALEAALNAPGDGPLSALLQAGPGLDPAQLRQRRLALRQQFADARWTVLPGTPLRDGRPTVNLRVSGSRVLGGSTFRLDAQQTMVLQSDGRHITGQSLLSESSLLRSGERALPVVVQVPDAVLTGQRYDVDLIVEEPLNGALVAGGLAAVTPQQVVAMESPQLELGALGGGGLFKMVRAPQSPGSQTWAMLLVHPDGVVAATKRVRVVADRRSLDP